MRVNFVGKDNKTVHSTDMESVPRDSELLSIGDDQHIIVGVRHAFEPTGRGGNYAYTALVIVRKL